MNIKLTICNLFARAAMLLLATVMSIGAWAQPYMIDLAEATIECDEGDFSKLLKGEKSHIINYHIKYENDELVELGEQDEKKEIYAQYEVEIKYKNTNGDYVPFTKEELRNIKNGHTLTISPPDDDDYPMVSYAFTINGIDGFSENSQTIYFSVVRFEGEGPYIISSKSRLKLVSDCVNGGITFAGEQFKLDNDLTFDNTDKIDKNDSYNFIPIGGKHNGVDRNFCGTFDGGGHTISGISINNAIGFGGLFGRLGSGAVVKNLTLDNTTITCHGTTGGIVGANLGGNITSCHVTSTVAINATGSDLDLTRFGGIVGNNGNFTYNNGTQDVTIHGSVSYCTSAVTISNAAQDIGGIAGYNESNCTLSHNLAINSAIPSGGNHGAIVGYNGASGILENNYYNGCKIGGTQINSNIGIGNSNIGIGNSNSHDVNGKAEPLTSNDNNLTTIILYDSGSKANENATTISNNTGAHNVVFAGRTLYKDGDWNTLCLPFHVTINGSVLSGADARTLSTTDFDSTTGTLTLDFTPSPEEVGSVTSLTAGTPYIIKWSNGENLVNPVFTDVTIASFEPEGTAADFLNSHAVGTNYAKFIGTYSPTGIYTSPAVNLYLGTNNTLYYPSAAKNINAFRAYFQLLNGLTAGDPESGLHVRAFSLNFDDDPTGIITTDYMDDMDKDGAWYSLDGRKYSAKPTAKGLYINKGKKVVIK